MPCYPHSHCFWDRRWLTGARSFGMALACFAAFSSWPPRPSSPCMLCLQICQRRAIFRRALTAKPWRLQLSLGHMEDLTISSLPSCVFRFFLPRPRFCWALSALFAPLASALSSPLLSWQSSFSRLRESPWRPSIRICHPDRSRKLCSVLLPESSSWTTTTTSSLRSFLYQPKCTAAQWKVQQSRLRLICTGCPECLRRRSAVESNVASAGAMLPGDYGELSGARSGFGRTRSVDCCGSERRQLLLT